MELQKQTPLHISYSGQHRQHVSIAGETDTADICGSEEKKPEHTELGWHVIIDTYNLDADLGQTDRQKRATVCVRAHVSYRAFPRQIAHLKFG